MKYGKDIEKQTLLLTDKYKDFVQNITNLYNLFLYNCKMPLTHRQD